MSGSALIVVTIAFGAALAALLFLAVRRDAAPSKAAAGPGAANAGADLGDVAVAARIIENVAAILYRLEPSPPHGVIYVSRNVTRYGYDPDELLDAPELYLESVHPRDRPRLLSDIAIVSSGNSHQMGGEYRIRTSDGRYLWFENRMHGVYDTDQRLLAIEGILIDIDDRKRAELALAHQAHTDPLTELPNREAFMGLAAQAFAVGKRTAEPFAIFYLDIDRFKDVNDTLGHSKGDELLKALALRLTGVVRKSDSVARFSGDEFAILLPGLTDPAEAALLATRIMSSVAGPYSILGSEVHVTVSIGITIYRPGVPNAEELFREADLALRQAKDGGRNQYRFHSAELDLMVRERVTLVGELRSALERNEFELHYQPQVDIPSGRIAGLEALVRWNHPRRGLLLPGQFIAAAEKSGLIVPLGRWVLGEVCRQVRTWRSMAIMPPITSFNLSAVQLAPPFEFERDLAAALRENGIDPGAIELELTESILMETSQAGGDTIERLRALGVRVAIDDFGTGYSSLEYLLAFHVHRLKIAQQFVRGLPDDGGSAAIVRATIGLAREFNIETVAEGVETAAQLEFLVKAGCRCIQGHYFGKAIPSQQTEMVLRRGSLNRV